jgi:hypothetical protein
MRYAFTSAEQICEPNILSPSWFEGLRYGHKETQVQFLIEWIYETSLKNLIISEVGV